MERLGDTAVDAQRHDEAISHYSTALSLDPPSQQRILIKRSRARVETKSWTEAIDDANQVHHLSVMEVNLVDPSSSGDRARSDITMGLRDQTYSIAQGRKV